MENGNYHHHVLVYFEKQEQLDIQRDPAHCGSVLRDVQKTKVIEIPGYFFFLVLGDKGYRNLLGNLEVRFCTNDDRASVLKLDHQVLSYTISSLELLVHHKVP